MPKNILISLNRAIKLIQKEKKPNKRETIKLEDSIGRVSSKKVT